VYQKEKTFAMQLSGEVGSDKGGKNSAAPIAPTWGACEGIN
jgi:hypothetical protein